MMSRRRLYAVTQASVKISRLEKAILLLTLPAFMSCMFWHRERTCGFGSQSLSLRWWTVMVLGAFAKLRKATISLVMSVCPSTRKSSATLDEFLWNFISEEFFEELPRKFQFHYNLARITGTSREYIYTFLIICCWILLKVRNVSDNFA
jgi:hypothetical protein